MLTDPHHDGSPLYRAQETPALGDGVVLRCRTSADVAEVWIRTTQDAEPTFHPCVLREPDGDVRWWEGEIPQHNPVMHYRFLVVERTGAQRWLTGAGVHDHDVPDTFDFKVSVYAPPPDWGRDAVVYQIFPDRFARSAAADHRPVPDWALPAGWDDPIHFERSDPRTASQFFGGDLDGVVDHLDHIAEVGADVVYTTPVFPAESNHRYNASTFDEVDPLLGGDDAYERLSTAVHARGWRILGDLTTNHTGDTHEWFEAAAADASSPQRGYYYFRTDGTYESWLGFTSLPKINHANPALRAAFVEGPDSIVGRWLRPPYDVDGWRIDVANMTGRMRELDINHDVARGVRRTATALRPDALVIGEHNHDASEDVDVDGWHATMNYSGFSWPVWEWLRADDSPARSFGTPVPIPQRTGPQVVSSMRWWAGRLGWQAHQWSWNILGSHDSARIRTVVGSSALHQVAAGLQFTLPGVPMIFAGDELGLEGIVGEDSRRTMPWHRPETWDHDTLDSYSALARLRREQVALRRGGLRWAHVDDDTLAFVREHPEGSVLVCARRAAGPAIRLPLAALGTTGARLLFSTTEGGEQSSTTEGGELVLPASDGPSFAVHRL
ncbi:glycoside hydrolase family 13 protein [Nocardioides sp.]|uniref:glycoside hydrolase family 13 protein n=1 Tax=Nocardioides sp. TaxID=35761 RepID=UPI003D13ED78